MVQGGAGEPKPEATCCPETVRWIMGVVWAESQAVPVSRLCRRAWEVPYGLQVWKATCRTPSPAQSPQPHCHWAEPCTQRMVRARLSSHENRGS